MYNLKKILGPGLLMAAAAIGVSHLVQSTRAGANFGYQLISVILLINLLKYPFFEFGHRFYASTGRTLLSGYLQLGKPFLAVFLALNFVTAMASVAGVTFVTGALSQNLFTADIGLTVWSAAILVLCLVLLGIGQYKGLDLFIKVLMVVLLLTTLVSVGISAGTSSTAGTDTAVSAFELANLGFLLALMGWMPAPIELSVWQSLWMEAAEKSSGNKVNLREAMFDFNFGYIVTVVLAVAFCFLGASVMFGEGATFSAAPATFASQVINLYTNNLGEWSRPIISTAAFATMFSTTITLIDAYPRSLAEGTSLFFKHNWSEKNWLRIWTWFNGAVALVIIWLFRSHLKAMVDLVTILAFLAGPLFAYLNLRLITSSQVPKDKQPAKPLLVISWVGILAMSGLSLVFILQKLGVGL
ncbi:MAG: divalent metal cation transporter [Pseudomonadota bacterium]